MRGLTAAAGQPGVRRTSSRSATRSRSSGCAPRGAICLGLTNMPPMANGGMQRGVYGRAESPYNADYLTAPFGSGSSNGSGTATAASFAAFGLGEETWSSGRAPASNNALCAYTPSRGVISVRGNWPLVPTMDVVVPHTRTMADLLEVLDVIVADDPETRGDFWRAQPWIELPRGLRGAARVVPRRCSARMPHGASVARRPAHRRPAHVHQRRPRGRHRRARRGIGGPTGQRIETRASVIDLWEAARRDLEAAGAEVVEVDFPVVSNYEGDRPGAPTIATRGLVTPEYLHREIVDLSAWAWDDFLARERRPGAASRSPRSTARRSSRTPRARCPTATPASTTTSPSTPSGCAQHPGATLRRHARARGGPARPRGDPPHRPRGVDGRPRPRRRRLPRGRRRRPGRHGRERGIRRSRLAQRRVGRQRQPRDPPPRHPDGHGADGHDGRHRDAGGPDLRRARLRRHGLLRLAAAFEATGARAPRRRARPGSPDRNTAPRHFECACARSAGAEARDVAQSRRAHASEPERCSGQPLSGVRTRA